MQTVSLFTDDENLREELRDLLPKGYRLVAESRRGGAAIGAGAERLPRRHCRQPASTEKIADLPFTKRRGHMSTKEEHFGTGLTLYGRDKYEEAIEELKRAVELEPSFADAHLAIGHALQKLKRLSEAAEAIKKAIGIYPEDPMYHTSLSTVYRDMGKTSEAEEELAISFQLQRGY